ncbi:hypothetical protein CTAYLR_000095 [Chrysophaeum taylorii]|uniref:Uncharacterized protein n=1 Tax=Chrysophaeum taylorii TaxID=2483200 RepID=A0AAD7UHH5_9STRA|nr:hypothetical protein CTAYLR_000095 [Chrysophaeum taylorii]
MLAPCVVEVAGLLISTQVDIVSPAHGSRWDGTPPLVLEALVMPPWLVSVAVVCVAVDDDASTIRCTPDPLALPEGLAAGVHRLEAYAAFPNGTRLDCHLREHDAVRFRIGPRNDDDEEKKKKRRRRGPPATIVTAADAPYFPRLSNLVGSLQTWEPELPVVVFDLGLDAAEAETASRWRNVRRVTPFFFEWTTTTTTTDVGLVGWKAWVILQILREEERSVLWLDANTEVRSPLDEVLAAIDETGYFLTVAGHRFPTAKTVRPATLAFFGCEAPFASLPECTSAFVGVKPKSRFHLDVLPKVAACSANRTCLYPPDSVGNTNQRRDQSALNAALCQFAIECTTADRRFWMWHGQKSFLPTEDPFSQNGMVLFSRRGNAQVYTPS